METVKFRMSCPHCGAGYKVPAHLEGEFHECQTCGDSFRLNADAPAPVIRKNRSPLPAPERAFSSYWLPSCIRGMWVLMVVLQVISVFGGIILTVQSDVSGIESVVMILAEILIGLFSIVFTRFVLEAISVQFDIRAELIEMRRRS